MYIKTPKTGRKKNLVLKETIVPAGSTFQLVLFDMTGMIGYAKFESTFNWPTDSP